jgi:ABC-2 type transport system ATP-binding protein
MDTPAPATDQNRKTLNAVIETEQLSRRFGAVVAVDRISLRVGSREVFGLIGPNGAGKSTLIKMLTTMLPPSSGRAVVAGFDIVKNPEQVRRHIGYVPQLLSSDRELTGYENLLLSARLYLIPAHEREKRIEDAIAMLSLGEARNRLVRDYSGGMLRRLEIAQSMLHRPSILFLDEPTVGLDPGGRHVVWDHVRALNQDLGSAIVLTTHYMDEAEVLCNRVALIHMGRLKAIGEPAQLKARFAPGGTLDDVYQILTNGSGSEPCPP